MTQLEEDGDGAALAGIVVALGRTLGMQTLAEGIEQPSQRALLMAAGCSLGQGFLFARSMPAARFDELVLRDRVADPAESQQVAPAPLRVVPSAG